MKKLLTLVGLIAPPMFACAVIDGDKILGRDLAAANPAFALLDPAMMIAPAPLPGIARVFRPDEIFRITRVNVPLAELCFERATELLTAARLLPVLRTALALDDAAIEIVDFSRSPVPRGELTFSKSGLSGSGLWRGRVTYDETKSASIWVRVRITVDRTWVEAAQPIASGAIIDASNLIAKTGPRFPFGPLPIASVDLATAHKALRSIRAGEPIFASMLTAPRDIERGDTVRVSVKSGGALLEFDGVAQSPARVGESVLIKNPASNRYFQARVEDKGKVSITK